jgi:hypothetical protein
VKAIRVLLGVFGVAAAVYGVANLVLTGPPPVVIGRYVIFAAVADVAHDLLLAPLALVAGALLARLAPAWLRGVLRAGLLVSAVVTLVAFPFVLHRGYHPSNPSALPLDYARGLLVTLAAVWLGTAVAAAVRYVQCGHGHGEHGGAGAAPAAGLPDGDRRDPGLGQGP